MFMNQTSAKQRYSAELNTTGLLEKSSVFFYIFNAKMCWLFQRPDFFFLTYEPTKDCGDQG